MAKNKVKPIKKVLRKISFDEIDHRLSCGWHVDLDSNYAIKKRIQQISNVNLYDLEERI